MERVQDTVESSLSKIGNGSLALPYRICNLGKRAIITKYKPYIQNTNVNAICNEMEFLLDNETVVGDHKVLNFNKARKIQFRIYIYERIMKGTVIILQYKANIYLECSRKDYTHLWSCSKEMLINVYGELPVQRKRKRPQHEVSISDMRDRVKAIKMAIVGEIPEELYTIPEIIISPTEIPASLHTIQDVEITVQPDEDRSVVIQLAEDTSAPLFQAGEIPFESSFMDEAMIHIPQPEDHSLFMVEEPASVRIVHPNETLLLQTAVPSSLTVPVTCMSHIENAPSAVGDPTVVAVTAEMGHATRPIEVMDRPDIMEEPVQATHEQYDMSVWGENEIPTSLTYEPHEPNEIWLDERNFGNKPKVRDVKKNITTEFESHRCQIDLYKSYLSECAQPLNCGYRLLRNALYGRNENIDISDIVNIHANDGDQQYQADPEYIHTNDEDLYTPYWCLDEEEEIEISSIDNIDMYRERLAEWYSALPKKKQNIDFLRACVDTTDPFGSEQVNEYLRRTLSALRQSTLPVSLDMDEDQAEMDQPQQQDQHIDAGLLEFQVERMRRTQNIVAERIEDISVPSVMEDVQLPELLVEDRQEQQEFLTPRESMLIRSPEPQHQTKSVLDKSELMKNIEMIWETEVPCLFTTLIPPKSNRSYVSKVFAFLLQLHTQKSVKLHQVDQNLRHPSVIEIYPR